MEAQLYGASTAALLVPGAIVAALVALAFAGGLGRLGTLGQAFSGPALPSAARAGGGPARAESSLRSVLAGGQPTPAPPSNPAPAPTVIDRVVGVATSVTSSVPAPVGPVATQLLQSAASSVDRIASLAPGTLLSGLHR